MTDITIKALNGQSFGAYCAAPKSANGAKSHGSGIIVIQEIFGVNATMRGICDDLAARGYLAVCPDLFWRQQAGVQLTDKTPEEWQRAFELFSGFDVEGGVRDLLSTLAHVRRMPECGGKVGAVGFCLGGKLAWLMASRSDVDCAVGYYGVGLEGMLHETHDIRMPLMLHIAELDEYAPPEAQKKILSGVARNHAITTHTYQAGHAFAREGGKNYDQTAADLANKRTLEFFAKNLQS